MHLKINFPFVVALYVIAVGVFFCVSYLMKGVFVDPKPPGSHFLVGISIIFIGAGIYFIYLLNQGKLEGSGKSITEVRQESIEKMKDTALLARIALEDQNPDIRKTAEERLEEVTN